MIKMEQFYLTDYVKQDYDLQYKVKDDEEDENK